MAEKIQPLRWTLTTVKQEIEEKKPPKLPIPPLLVTARPAKKPKKRKSVEEKAATKRALEKARAQTRVNVGAAFQRWRQLRDQMGLKSDAKVADFLLDSYEKNPSTTLPKDRSKRPPPQHVSTIVSESLIDRDHNTTDEEEASDAAFNHKVHSNSSTGSSSGNTEHLDIKKEQMEFWENKVGNQLCGQQQSDIIAVVVKSEDDEEKPVTQLTEVNVKEEPQTCSSADVIKKEEPEDNYEQQTETS
ncbi:uncharacterized protein LOC114461400 isoform X1 [Gouania willdenowi]|uniref:uncharacterized protein LOC114461400 isoform X1 n=1 Tax=Gouania willdenowi TaxID=441366 RepID=UPI001055A975|nr:uncharacterized protein LOC114461400 isoform X1 [Gouania willdenowi]